MSVAIHNWSGFPSDMKFEHENNMGSEGECSFPSSPIEYDTRDLIPPALGPGEPEPYIRIQENIVSNKWVFIDFGKMEWKTPEISFTIKTYSQSGRPESVIPVFRIDFFRTENRLTEYAFQVVRLRPCQRSNEECGFTLHASDRSARSFRAGRQTFIPSDHKLGFRTRCTTHVRKGHFMCDGYRWYQGNVPVSNVFRICGRPGGTKRKGSSQSEQGLLYDTPSGQGDSRPYLPRAVSADHTAYFASLSVSQQEIDEAPLGSSPRGLNRYRHSKSTDFDANSYHGFGGGRSSGRGNGAYDYALHQSHSMDSQHSDLEEMLDMCHELPQIAGGAAVQQLRAKQQQQQQQQRGRANSDGAVVLQDALMRMLIDMPVEGDKPGQQQMRHVRSGGDGDGDMYESRDQWPVSSPPSSQQQIQSDRSRVFSGYSQSWRQESSSPVHPEMDPRMKPQTYHPQKRGFPNTLPADDQPREVAYSDWIQQTQQQPQQRAEGSGMPPRCASVPVGEDLNSWVGHPAASYHHPYRGGSQQQPPGQQQQQGGGMRGSAAYLSPQSQHVAKQRQAYYQRTQSVSSNPYGHPPRRNSHHAPVTASEQASLWATSRRASEGMALEVLEADQLANTSSRFSIDTNDYRHPYANQSVGADRTSAGQSEPAARRHGGNGNLGHFAFSENAKESPLSTLFTAPELNTYLDLIIKESTSPSMPNGGSMSNPHSSHHVSNDSSTNFVISKENPVLNLANQFQVGRFM